MIGYRLENFVTVIQHRVERSPPVLFTYCAENRCQRLHRRSGSLSLGIALDDGGRSDDVLLAYKQAIAASSF
jgi:hypothetical protein